MIMTKRPFIPVDIIALGYMAVTLLYMAIGWNSLTDVWSHIFVRLAIVVFIITMSQINPTKLNNNILYNLFRNLYPLLLLTYFYKETGYLNNILFDYLDPWFVSAEQHLWGMQPSLEFSKHFPQKWFSEIMNFSYFFYYLLTIGIGLVAYFWNRSKMQEIIFIIFTSFIIYYLFFALFPVKGPQFYFYGADAKPVDAYFFSKLVKIAQGIGETQTGAFPSSHVGMSIVFLILTWKYLRKAFWFILVPIIFLWFATVYIKAHYLIDVVGGFLSAPLVYYASKWLYKTAEKETGEV